MLQELFYCAISFRYLYMARHDYEFPPEWESMSDEEKCRWMSLERCRRQAEAQGLSEEKIREDAENRFDRRVSANGFVRLRDNR